jgi:hypothetical protein
VPSRARVTGNLLGPVAALVLAGCASTRAPEPGPSPARRPSACVIASDSVGPARPLVVAYSDADDARRGRLAADRLTPLRRNCEGRFLPGFAVRWSADTTGAFWTLTLEGWTAGDLAASWRADPEAEAALRSAGVTSLVPMDDRRLVVGFAAPSSAVPAVFTDRALGVSRPGEPRMVESESSREDLRDAVDHGADLIVTADPDLLDYAARRPAMAIVPIPWDRTYYLVLPAGSAGVSGAVPGDTAGFRASLARDAVRVDARAAGDSGVRCPAEGGAVGAAGRSGAIAHPKGERTAEALAERIVALVHPAELQVQPLEPEAFARALARGEARAFIVPRFSRTARCADWPAGASVVPLVETRRHAIVRRGAPLLVVDWDGAVRPAEPADTAAP